MDTFFHPGHYYRRKDDLIEHICRKNFLGLWLCPVRGLNPLPVSVKTVSFSDWIECTDAYKRSLAILEAPIGEPTNNFQSLIGTVVAYNDNGTLSVPYLLVAYSEGVAYLMPLDGKDKVIRMFLDACYPMQKMYQDVVARAIDPDPMKSSRFSEFLRWLGRTPHYRTFTKLVSQAEHEEKEDMMRLFELMIYDGIATSNFEAEVDRLYEALPDSEKGGSKYSTVLYHYKGKAASYSNVEKEIMRKTNMRFSDPKEAWKAQGNGKPYPTATYQIDIQTPPTPHQYVCDVMGYYDGRSRYHWIRDILPTLQMDVSTPMDEANVSLVDTCAAVTPFDMTQLDFIQEEDKAAVFRRILKVQELDKADPYRAWLKNPPPHFKEYRRDHPEHAYVEIFRILYTAEVEHEA